MHGKVPSMRGKFQGMIIPHTPTGSDTTSVVSVGENIVLQSPGSRKHSSSAPPLFVLFTSLKMADLSV